MRNLFFTIFIILILIQNCLTVKNYNAEDQKKWKWQSESTNHEVYKNRIRGGSYVTSYVDLASGIEIKDEGIKWSLQVTNHQFDDQYGPEARICFGITTLDQKGLRYDGDQTNLMIGGCSRGQIYNYAESVHTVISQIPKYGTLFKETIWDIILETDKMILTNEDRGGDSRIEWNINPDLQYIPIVFMYHSNQEFASNTCSPRCETCKEFEYDTCLTCKTGDNKLAAPSCECKSGFTDVYDQKINQECIAENKTWFYPKQRDWQWDYGNSIRHSDITQKIYDARVTNHYDGNLQYVFVNLENGMEPKLDGYKWQIKIEEETVNQHYAHVCFGVTNKDNYGQALGVYEHNMFCTDTYLYNKNAIRTRDYGNLVPINYCFLKIGQIWELTFESTNKYLTISNIKYGGTRHYEMDLDKSIDYIPYIYIQGNYLNNWVLSINTCLQKCQDCKFFEPATCTGCQNSENREEPPGCECKQGFQDSFVYPDEHYIHENCIVEYEYEDLKLPGFQWQTKSTKMLKNDYDLFGTNTSRYTTVTSELGNKGLQVVKDGLRWQIKITDHGYDSICFGVMKTENLFNLNYDYYIPQMCGICTDRTYRLEHCLSKKQYGSKIMFRNQGIGQVYDLIYNYGYFSISNKRYGGDLFYEFKLSDILNFVPIISLYSSSTGYIQNQVQLKTCKYTCESCIDWQPEQCILCNDPDNREPPPFCRCKEGYEDVYDHKEHKECRRKIQWHEPSPPEWVWESKYENLKSTWIKEEHGKEGIFEVDYDKQASLWIKGRPILQDKTKWTIRILDHEKGSLCFGISEYSRSQTQNNPDAAYQNGIGVCTVAYVFSDGYKRYIVQDTMPGANQEQFQTYELYYRNNNFVITNQNYGGSFYHEWELYENHNFIPYMSKYAQSGTIGQSMKFQIKACNIKCESCVDWEPLQCLTCSNAENRKEAPGCECIDNYEDYYDYQYQKICRKVPNYKKPVPSEWIFQTKSVYVHELKETKQFGTFINNNFSYYGTILLKDLNKLQDQTQWEIKIKKHVQAGHLCMGIIEVGLILDTYNWNSNNYGSSTVFCTDNSIFNPDGINGAGSKTKILNPMPSGTRQLLENTTFKLTYTDGFLNINNLESGGKSNADFQLKTYVNYTPYIYFHNDVVIQVKNCSHRCQQCVDFEPTQCTICSDHFNRQEAPACYCKKGFYDTYNRQDNVKCIPIPIYTEYKYPEWQWYTQSIYAFEDDNKRGIFENKGGYANYFLKEGIKLKDKTKWTINILNHYNQHMCFGIMKSEEYSLNWSWEGTLYTQSVSYCTNHSYFINGASAIKIISHFYHPVQNIKGYLDFFYENDILTISNYAYGGEVKVEFYLYENVQYTPIVHMYDSDRNDLNDNIIQFSNCNLNCYQCAKWKPDFCESCQGSNRLNPPDCQCKLGYIDVYKNQKNIDCIKKPNEIIPLNDWKWTTQSNYIGYVKDEWKIFGSSIYGFIYVDLGRNGIPYTEEGFKWSLKIQSIGTNGLICFGLLKVQSLDPTIQNQNADVQYISTGTCTNQISYPEGFYKEHVQLELGVNNEGMTFDIIYRENFLSISSIPYGGTSFIEFKLNQGQKYVPFVSYYKYDTQIVKFDLEPCSYKCSTCDKSVSKNQCLVCRDAVQRTAAPECNCLYGFYDNGTSICQACVFPCKSCVSESSCSTCQTQENRLNNPPYCSCQDQHFQDEELRCKPCAYWCGSCKTKFDSCIICKIEPGRKTDPLDCSCKDGYYEDPQTQSCQQCPSSCSTCSNGSGGCDECVSSQIMINGICSCATTSFEYEGGCAACINPCLTCESYSVCKTCRNPSIFRNDIPSCLCKEGYFEDESYICQKCMDGCAVCQNFANNCITCKEDENRSQDPTDCSCNQGYFEDNATGECKINECPEKCGGDCVVGSSTQCNSCAQGLFNRSVIVDNCDCADGFYDVGQLVCAQCNPQCGTCTDTSGCLTCASFGNRGSAPLCQCKDGYYDNLQGSCEECHFKCSTCDTTPDQCKVCTNDPNRYSSGTCACKPGFTEDPVQQKCSPANPCDLQCATCSSTNYSECLSCKPGQLFRYDITKNCNCLDGYFDNGEEECKQCEFPCETCTGLGQCITCQIFGANRSGPPLCACETGFVQDTDTQCISATGCKKEVGRHQFGECLCKDGFYEDLNTNTCPQCSSKCKTCTDFNICVTCAIGHRSDTVPDCDVCPRKCGDCDSSGCLTCNFNRDDSTNDCLCMLGYYDDGFSRDCKRCASKCSTCTTEPSNCLQCASMGIGRGPAPECACKSGYFEKNGVCEKCAIGCLTCKNSKDNCIICNFGKNRSKIAPACSCDIGYFNSHFTPNCQKCTTECINRDNETGQYTTSTGSTYSFGSSELNTKQDYLEGTLPEEPNVIPDDYVDDGEGNLIPASFLEEILIEKEKEKVQQLIEEQKEKEEEAIALIQEKEALQEAIQQELESQQQEVQVVEQLIIQQEAEKQTQQQIINQKQQEIDDAIVQKTAKETLIIQKQAEIQAKIDAGEDATALQNEVLQITAEKEQLDTLIATTTSEKNQSEAIVQEIDNLIQQKVEEKQSIEEVIQDKQQEVNEIQQTIQDNQEIVQQVQDTIQEKEQEIELIQNNTGSSSGSGSQTGGNGDGSDGNVDNSNSDQEGSDNKNQDSSTNSFSINVSSGSNQSSCSGPCSKCEPLDPLLCTVCAIGLNRLNNPPLCSCEKGYFEIEGTNNCQQCSTNCLTCSGQFNFCTSCHIDSNRQVDNLSGNCECLPGFSENKHGRQCQRCFNYKGACYYKCPENTVLDDLSFNCIEFKQSLEDIKSTIVLYGFLAFLSQFIIFFGIFKLSKRTFERQYGLAPKPQVHEIYELDEDSIEDIISSDEKLDSKIFNTSQDKIEGAKIQDEENKNVSQKIDEGDQKPDEQKDKQENLQQNKENEVEESDNHIENKDQQVNNENNNQDQNQEKIDEKITDKDQKLNDSLIQKDDKEINIKV